MMNERTNNISPVLKPLADDISQFLKELQSPIPDEIRIDTHLPKKKPKVVKITETGSVTKWHFIASNQTRNCPNCMFIVAVKNTCGLYSCGCANEPARPRFLSKTAKLKN